MEKQNLNFAVGPVMMSDETRMIGGNAIPYFRTSEFSDIMLENETLFKKTLNAPDSARAVFLTGSGTASMEAAVVNTLDHARDKALVIDGGSFGHRFTEILQSYQIPFDALCLPYGKTLTQDQLSPYENKNYTTFLVNLGETSTGVLYDTELIADFCRRNELFLIIDAVSSYLADPLDMRSSGADVILTGSQKALALAPGLSLLLLSERAQKKIRKNRNNCYYFDLKKYLKDGERGQTPFTPAVSVLLQLNARLKAIEWAGGAKTEIEKTAAKANYFRCRLENLPFSFFADKKSNAVTSLVINNANRSAYRLFEILKDEFGIWICPNGGELKEKVFRVGHMGELSFADYDTLLYAMHEIISRNII